VKAEGAVILGKTTMGNVVSASSATNWEFTHNLGYDVRVHRLDQQPP